MTEEYLDVLDENGEKLGRVLSRSEVHRVGAWHKSTHVWIYNSKGEILIQKRAPQKEVNPNMWDISVAGHLTAGDNDIEGTLREIHEEIGIEISPEELIHLGTQKKSNVLKDGTYFNNQFDLVYALKLDLDISKLILQEEEVAEVKFIPYREYSKLIETRHPEFTHHVDQVELLVSFLDTKFNN